MKRMKMKRIGSLVVAGLSVSLWACQGAQVRPTPVNAIASANAPLAAVPDAGVAAAPKPSQSELFAEGVAAFQKGKLDDAEDRFTRVLDDEPDNVRAQYDLGVTFEKQPQESPANRRAKLRIVK